MFTPPLFMSGSSYKLLRNKFLNDFGCVGGYLMNANEFDGTSNWGLSFTIWDKPNEIKNDFILKLNESDEVSIINKGDKIIYNMDNLYKSSDWIREEIKNIKTNNDIPQMTSAINVKVEGKTMRGSIIESSIGYFLNASNNVYENTSQVSIFTHPCSKGNGLNIIVENYNKVTTLFTVRKLIKSTWINQKDEYIAPTEEVQLTTQYKQFESDSIVYSLFNTSSNQSSMRQVEYKDKLWDIKNEFFFMSTEEMKGLAEEHKFDELYKDVRQSDERYVYNLLKTTNLSPDALDVLETARELVRKTFEWRKIMHQTNPEYHLDTWDAGWYQIKKILNEHFKDEYKVFVEKYKKFEERLRPQVYELGFLKDA